MTAPNNPVFSAYSRMAADYDDEGNAKSCWWEHTDKNVRSIVLKEGYHAVADIGCGTGVQLHQLAAAAPRSVRFFGVEPAENMRNRAVVLNAPLPNVTVLEGAFEHIPLEDASIDYMYSINAFHWAVDPAKGLAEVQRVLRAAGELDFFFIGRDIGREFIRATTPIFMKYMGPKALLQAVKIRRQYTRDDAAAFFGERFGAKHVQVDEVYETYYDTVDGHLGWWVRIEPQLLSIPAARKAACDQEIHNALAALDRGKGVPYTMHQIHVRVQLG